MADLLSRPLTRGTEEEAEPLMPSDPSPSAPGGWKGAEGVLSGRPRQERSGCLQRALSRVCEPQAGLGVAPTLPQLPRHSSPVPSAYPEHSDFPLSRSQSTRVAGESAPKAWSLLALPRRTCQKGGVLGGVSQYNLRKVVFQTPGTQSLCSPGLSLLDSILSEPAAHSGWHAARSAGLACCPHTCSTPTARGRHPCKAVAGLRPPCKLSALHTG